ncbi:MAG: hypothetical protein R2764_23515 [Bacteroidales bacterium]
MGLEFNDLLFVNLQARNDWSSTLPIGNNSFFYPGATMGFIFSDLIPENKILSYGKFRLSYALANDAAPFMTSVTDHQSYAQVDLVGLQTIRLVEFLPTKNINVWVILI